MTTNDPREIGVGMLGYAFMGKAHSNAFRKIDYMTWPPPLGPRLVSIAGRNEDAVSEAAGRYGFERWTSDWRELVADPEIGLFDNLGPNDLHAEPTILAAEAGKHVVCEKPLGRDADESYEIWRRVAATGVQHMCAFNYRFVPAVRLARELIEAGDLGDLRHFRGRYLQDWGDTDEEVWRFDRDAAGSGALGDLAAHVVDLARYLVGEIETSGASSARSSRIVRSTTRWRRRWSSEAAPSARSRRRGSRSAAATRSSGRSTARRARSRSTWSGSTSSRSSARTASARAGSRPCSSRRQSHPFWEHWWPPGHIIGWGDTFVHELHHFLAAIAGDTEVAPHGATFEDGYRAAEVCDAIVRSGRERRGARRSVPDDLVTWNASIDRVAIR